ncbi:MAG: ankyrin repeat domain-containing protein [Pyrinomonadaceae bacterium]
MTNDEMWQKALSHLSEGNFTALEQMLGGPEGFDRHIVEWHSDGKFDPEPEMLDEALSCACMLGRTDTSEFLIDSGIDPYAGMRTWLAGPHYAVSGGHVETVKMLIEKGVPLEVENKYGGTMLGQALWSAINEHKKSHAAIIEILISAGAHVWPGTIEWWDEQNVPSVETKLRVAAALEGANSQNS